MQVFKLCWKLANSVFNNYWLCFNFCIAPLIYFSVGITSSVAGIKICAITVGIKKYKSIIKKEEKSMRK